MNLKITALAIAALCCPVLHAQEPDPQAILENARVAATLTTIEDGLEGSLSHAGAKTPIVLFLKGKDIQFQFSENGGWQKFHMRLTDDSYDLFDVTSGETKKFPDAKIIQPIAGTDLTYEDLALRFFYWPNPKFEGQEEVNGQLCYKLRVDKPKGTPGRYDTVYIWVHTKFGAFMQIKGYKNSALLKEFQVTDVMEIGGGVWTLKKMQVSTYAGERRVSITDVVFNPPKKSGPRGTR